MNNPRSRLAETEFTLSQVITLSVSFLFFAIGGFGILTSNATQSWHEVYTPHQIPYVTVSRAGIGDIDETLNSIVDRIEQDQVSHNRVLLEASYNFYHRVTETEIDGEPIWMMDVFLEYTDTYYVLAYFCELDNPNVFRCTPLLSFE